MSKGFLSKKISIAMSLVLITSLFGVNPIIRSQKVQAVTYKTYFGDLHAHTGFSDGTGTPSQAFTAAKNGGADFIAITDHNRRVSNDGQLTPQEWEDLKNTAINNSTSTFVAIAGYEQGLASGTGHINCYNTDNYINYDLPTLDSFYSTLQSEEGVLAQWNHPRTYSDDFRDYTGYSSTLLDHIRLLEIFNNGEVSNYPTYESSFIKALDRGWKMSPTANSDTHSTNWITGYECRSAVLAETLSKEAIYDAIRNNRIYATMDKNLKIDFTINSNVMGSKLSGSNTFNIIVNASDPDTSDVKDKIAKIEIISDGGVVVAVQNYSGYTANLTTTLTSTTAQYYFARITNAEGKKAWSAPIWTGNIKVKEYFIPESDTYVRNGTYAATNYGKENTLMIKSDGSNGYTRKGYISFKYPSLNNTSTTSAKIKLYASNVNTEPTRTIKVYGTQDESWTETGINWNNSPAGTTYLGSITVSNTANTWYELDVTGYINSHITDKFVSVLLINEALASSSNNVEFTTKESGANMPVLEISVN